MQASQQLIHGSRLADGRATRLLLLLVAKVVLLQLAPTW
jgi:hypothetical protein